MEQDTYMKTTHGNLPRVMETHLRITSVVILCVSAYLLLPKITDATAVINTFTANGFSTTSNQSLTTPKLNHEGLKVYIPPNYGGPDSQHGSGTR
ncbi:MAG: hypothetical protein ACFKPT_11000 [Gloeotrichia echinulata GP01]